MQLYSYFRSSAAYRVRIALHLKNLSFDYVPLHLLRNGGEQYHADYLALNPQGLVPTLIDQNSAVTQSLAIMEYLEEQYPTPALLPTDPIGRAQVRALALTIACEMHPLNNLRVLNYLTQSLGASEEDKKKWYHHWLHLGFTALEEMVSAEHHQGFCYGPSPSIADCCLIPQLYNARRFEVNLAPYPTLLNIEQNCLALPAFQTAHPDAQPDAILSHS